MNKFGTLNIAEAIRIIDEYDAMSKADFDNNIASNWRQRIINEEGLSEYDLNVRNEIKAIFEDYYAQTGGNRNKMYPLDLNIGLKIYELLKPGKDGFTLTDATDDDMWRYITIKVIPDLTYIRYPANSEKGAKNINRKRFYKDIRRIWIKTLWWYVFLSWQGSSELTYEVLKNNHIDNINKLIETPGKGYRLSVYRAMMYEYSERQHNTKYFAGVTKLNNTKCKTIEPELLAGGEKEYAKLLFDEVPIMSEQEEEDAEE